MYISRSNLIYLNNNIIIMTDLYGKEFKELSNSKYSITNNLLGVGAFGKVFQCKENANKKKGLVVKIYPMEYKKYAVHEINVFNKLNKHKKKHLDTFGSSNIIGFYDYYVSNEFIYAIFEKASISLEDFIIQFNKRFQSRPPLFLTISIINGILNGLIELNESNIMHCDLKMDNIFIIFDKNIDEFFKLFHNNIDHQKIRNSFTIKLIDLNKSTFINQICKSTTIQTLEFQAPEIALGNNNYNSTVDTWSVGIILWNLITGFNLIDFDNIREEYYPFYKDFILESLVSERTGSSESSDSNSSKNTSYYDSTDIDNLVYLYKLSSVIGGCDKNLLVGNNINNYYRSNMLLGQSCIKHKPLICDIIMSELPNFKINEQDLETKLKYICELLSQKILIYNMNDRLTPYALYEILNT